MPKAAAPQAVTSGWRAVRGRIERIPSGVREIATSAMLVMILVIGVVWNLPDSAIRRAAVSDLSPIALPVGLDQGWTMFAPNPPRRLTDLEVLVTMADGSIKAWRLPRLGPVFGVAFSHRWRKLGETLENDERIRPDFAHWAVGELAGPDDHPIRVEMLLHTVELPPPGADHPGRTSVQRLYREDLTPAR